MTPTWEPVESVPEKCSGKPGMWLDLVLSFAASGHRMARVTFPAGREVRSVQGCIIHAIERRGLGGVLACRTRKGEVYLERLTNGREP